MDERDRNGKISPEIYVYATNKNFLNVYDALRIEKVKIEVAGYDQATSKQTGIASAWLDIDDLRLMIHLVTTRQFKDVLDRGRFEKFGGSERDGVIESRTLLVEWDPGEGNRFARFPYRVTIANGPGTRTANGAVQPTGEPTSRMSMRLPEADMMKILLSVGAYVEAHEANNHERTVAQKVRDLQQKMSERNGRLVPSRVVEEAPEEAPAARPAAQPRPTPAPAAAPRQAPAPLRVVGRQEAPAAPAPRPAPTAANNSRSVAPTTMRTDRGEAVRPTRSSATSSSGKAV